MGAKRRGAYITAKRHAAQRLAEHYSVGREEALGLVKTLRREILKGNYEIISQLDGRKHAVSVRYLGRTYLLGCDLKDKRIYTAFSPKGFRP